MRIALGDKVKDTISGFIGVAVSFHDYLNGCRRISIQPPITKDKKLPEAATFDEPQLEIVKPKKVPKGSTKTGGPDKYMDEGRK